MPRGRKKKLKLKLNIKPETTRSIIALLIILFAVLSVVALILPDYVVNAKISALWRGLLGYSAVFTPVILLAVGLLLIPSIDAKIKEPRVLSGLVLFQLTLAALFHIFIPEENKLTAVEMGKGGGFIGMKISGLLADTVSVYGGVIILFLLLAVCVILIFDISFETISDYISEKIENFRLPEFRFKKGADDSEDEIEVTSGQFGDSAGSTGAPSGSLAVVEPVTHSITEPVIEVIPSFSEPQDYVVGSGGKPGMSKDQKEPRVPSVLGPGRDRIWQYPPLDLLEDYSDSQSDGGDTSLRAKKIKEVLKSFGIDVEISESDVKVGPSVTQYGLRTEFGTRVAQIASLQNDMAMALASPTGTVRIEAPIPGKSLIGVEVPNNTRSIVGFRGLITSDAMKGMKSKLGIVLGKDVGGRVLTYDIAKMPHMLVAGTTGSGKSIFIHNVIFSLLYRATPHEVKFILIDPKRVELKIYADIPHLITPVVTDMDKAPSVFKWAAGEMDRRYRLLEKAHVPNIETYNEQSGFQAMPYIMIVVDELAEIMMIDTAGVEKTIIRLAQLARAVGIHLLLAVQRPSTNIITGAIKANIPCRVAFNVASQIDSRVIIDQQGAEKLLGKGDMLFVPPDISKPVRLQGGFISTQEINRLVAYLKDQGVPPMYDESVTQSAEKSQGMAYGQSGGNDEYFDEAVEIVIMARKASASLLQRKLSIGYARAARIMDELEARGIIASSDGTSKPRDVLISEFPAREIEADEDTDNPVDSLQHL